MIHLGPKTAEFFLIVFFFKKIPVLPGIRDAARTNIDVHLTANSGETRNYVANTGVIKQLTLRQLHLCNPEGLPFISLESPFHLYEDCGVAVGDWSADISVPPAAPTLRVVCG